MPGILSAAGRVPEQVVRVSILSSDKILLSSRGSFSLSDASGGNRTVFEAGWVEVLASGSGLSVEGKEFSGHVRFSPGSEPLAVNGRRYRGTVSVINDGVSLLAVNETEVEGYLKGVLPVEVSPSWPLEALKAQAVVSRTYVINNLGRYSDRGYDVSSDVFSQVYRGMDVEDPASNRAVKETAGIVLGSGGEVIRAYFHSCCGGYTENISSVWGSSQDHMGGVDCHYCDESPRYNWERSLTPAYLERRLEEAGAPAGAVEGIELLSRTSSGRVGDMRIAGSEGDIELTGHRFRMIIGPDVLKSAMFALDRDRDDFHFYGRGWGHGVGMCQWGARGQALEGRGYREILEYYFPGTRIIKHRR